MKVYVIRHGESETNKIHYWTGWLDVSLTDKGRELLDNEYNRLNSLVSDYQRLMGKEDTQ